MKQALPVFFINLDNQTISDYNYTINLFLVLR